MSIRDSFAFSPAWASIARRSFRSESSRPCVVGDLEHGGEYASLRVVQVQDTRQQQWPYLGHRGARSGMALFKTSQQVTGERLAVVAGELEQVHAISDALIAATGLGQPGQIALHVSHEHPARRGEKPSASTRRLTVFRYQWRR